MDEISRRKSGLQEVFAAGFMMVIGKPPFFRKVEQCGVAAVGHGVPEFEDHQTRFVEVVRIIFKLRASWQQHPVPWVKGWPDTHWALLEAIALGTPPPLQPVHTFHNDLNVKTQSLIDVGARSRARNIKQFV